MANGCCERLAPTRRLGNRPYKSAVNVSPVWFLYADLPKLVLEVLLETGLSLNRSFMGEVESSRHAKGIIRAVLALGKSLDIPGLAESIETEGQFALLGLEGCDEAQGYFLGRPAPLHQIVASGQISLTRERLQQEAALAGNRGLESKSLSA